MKKYLGTMMIFCSLIIFAGSAFAYTVNSEDVGGLDVIFASASLGNSGSAENAWLAANEFVVVNEYPGSDLEWYNVSGSIWAAQLLNSPEFFFIKIGTGGTSITNSHFMYRNNTQLTWAVIDLAGWGGGTANNINVGRISHIGESTSVPEPLTLILLGMGLLGIAGIRRKN